MDFVREGKESGERRGQPQFSFLADGGEYCNTLCLVLLAIIFLGSIISVSAMGEGPRSTLFNVVGDEGFVCGGGLVQGKVGAVKSPERSGITPLIIATLH